MRINFSQVLRHKLLMQAVVAYKQMSELPKSVLDQIAQLKPNLPVVFVIYYGGTIGMERLKTAFNAKVYGPTSDAAKLLEPLNVKGLDKEVQVVWVPVFKERVKGKKRRFRIKAIDSTNGRWPHWVSIANCIRLLYDRGDGFVVCGGTDTMAHMLAAMRFIFPNIGKPIVGTGSQVPMVELGDDATNNLYFAIVAAASNLKGIFLMFGDRLMNGWRVHKAKDKRRDAFTCPEPDVVGHFDDQLRIYPHAPKRDEVITKERLIFRPGFREGVKVVHISPATPSESLLHDAADPTCSAMILITFGAGNVRDEGVVEEELTHIQCLWKLFQRRFPVVLGSPMVDGVVESHYESGVKAVSTAEGDGNAISGGRTTGPLLEVKCMVALDHAWKRGRLDYDLFRQFMEDDHVGELAA